jgi:monoamine oxidase
MNDHVRIETSSGLILEAECCVSTIPLGCLKNSAETLFEPTLGDDKLEAIRSISAGAYKKVFLTFHTIFWPVEKAFIGLIREKSDELGKYLLVNNLWAKDGIPCLEATLCGDLGNWAIDRSDEAIKMSVIEFLEDAMGLSNLQERCTDCHVTRWEEDPFTLGSYSSFRLGTLERHIESFSLPEWGGRLIFAGEHTESEHQGSVHAALMSGKKAAEVVRGFLSSDTNKSVGEAILQVD